MRVSGMVLLLGLVACSAPGMGRKASDAASLPASPAPFAGTWESCDGASSPAECSRYVLVQRGERICGTWSYVASEQLYEGRVVARATSASQARRTHVCGRPGSETGTECDGGWEIIDRPLLLCDGKLGDLVGSDGRCLADYQAVPASQSRHGALSTEPWARDCLSSGP